jgi:hypothetical protein
MDSAFINSLVESIAPQVVARVKSEVSIPAAAWPRWMTMKTAAKYIDHTDRSFEYLMSKDLFPVVRRDRLVLLDREDIDNVLKHLKR